MPSNGRVPASLRLTVFAMPLLYLAISVPLALRLIGPNGVYGYRTRSALSSPEAWYELNAIAGWTGVSASIISLVAIAAIAKSGVGEPLSRYLLALGVAMALMLSGLAVPAMIGA